MSEVKKIAAFGELPSGPGKANVIFLIASGIVLTAVYICIPFESAVLRLDYSKGNILDFYPEMRYINSIPYDQYEDVQIFSECAKKSHCYSLQKAFGIPDKDLSFEVRQSGLDCCMAVVQHWYIMGSHPPNLYPITWGGMVNAWRSIGEEEFADKIQLSLQKLMKTV